IAWYCSNSACQAAALSGGSIPVTGRHSTIDRPDSVSLVAPPTSTMRKISAATESSHNRTARRWTVCAGELMGHAALAGMRSGPYRPTGLVAIDATFAARRCRRDDAGGDHAYSHPEADRRDGTAGAPCRLVARRDGVRPVRARLGEPPGRRPLLRGSGHRLAAARDGAGQLDVAAR